MNSQEYLESKATKIEHPYFDEVVDLKDALIAIEMAELETKIQYWSGDSSISGEWEQQLSELKLKHNIPL